MFKRINQRKIDVDYILIDSWLTTITLLSKFKEINKNVNVIGVYKYNSKVKIGDKEQTINPTYKIQKRY